MDLNSDYDYRLSVSPKTVMQIRKSTDLQQQSKDVNLKIEELGKKRIGYERMFLAVILMVVAGLIIHFLFIFLEIS